MLITWRAVAVVLGVALLVGWWGEVELIWLVPWAVANLWLADGDIRTRLIPRRGVYLATLLTAGCLVGAVVLVDQRWGLLIDAALGGAGAFIALLVMRVLSSGGVGGGDVRLAGLIGLGVGSVMGGFGGLVAIAAGWILHALIAVGGLAKRLLSMESTLPLGPSLVLAAMGVVVAIAFFLNGAG